MLRRARMPAFLVTTLALMYRYLFVLGDEAQRMRAARASRTFARGRVRVWRALGTVIAQLFVRSTERAEALIGPNGAGKSTLLLHFNGILPERHDGPAVRIFGEPVVPEALERIRRKVGLLFQDPDDQLFCPTVHEDVAFGPEQFELSGTEVRRIVAGAPARVWLTGFESRAPHHRSAGEKRRVCLAGVLACELAVIVLDEPTSNLDPCGRRELRALLHTIPATTVIATHDLELVVELCMRAVLLDGAS